LNSAEYKARLLRRAALRRRRLHREQFLTAKRDEVPLGFRVDNVHWARDGSLLAVAQGQQAWKAVKIDPNTLAVREVLVQTDTAEFNAGTALAEVGNACWVGSFRGNRIVILPVQ
jgi:hypothetical protein